MRRLLCVCGLAAVMAGCGQDEGGFIAPIPDSLVRPLIVLDLTTGTTYAAAEGFTPTATRLVFRRLHNGSRSVSAGDTLGETGATSVGTSTATVSGSTWMSVYELSQAQWNTLAGDSLSNPWNAVAPNDAGGGSGAIAGTMPAWGIAGSTCETVLASWNASFTHLALRLPTGSEWEYAARSPSGSGAYGWGDDPTKAGAYALVRETGDGTGPQAITAGEALGGYHNLHGNVWEWVGRSSDSSLHLRGGSWCDTVRSAQSGNRRACGPDVNYALAGLRPVLVLP